MPYNTLERSISSGTKYDILVGQGGRVRAGVGAGGTGGSSRVQEDGVTILEVTGGSSKQTTIAPGGVVATPSVLGATGGQSSATHGDAPGASDTWNYGVPIPKDVWNVAIQRLGYKGPATFEVNAPFFGGGGSAGEPTVGENASWGAPTYQNAPIAYQGALTRPGASATLAVNDGNWGAGGGGAHLPLTPGSGLEVGGTGGNGFVVMWFKHPTNK